MNDYFDNQIKADRTLKGKSLCSNLSNYVALDITTTGFISDYDYLLEVSACKIRDGKVIDSFNILINNDVEIDPFIYEKTGLNSKYLTENGVDLSIALEKFYSFIKDEVVVTHYGAFVINFLFDVSYFEGYILKNDYIDTVRVAKRVNPNLESYSLDNLSSSLNIVRNSCKRALYDVITIHSIYELLRKDITDYNVIRKHSLTLKERIANLSIVDISHDNPQINNKVFVFTGTMDTLTRIDACELVLKLGGICESGITKKVNYLVIGSHFTHTKNRGKSKKLMKTEELISNGYDIRIIDEHILKDMIEEY